jgi:hypothetical protein
MRNFHPFGMPPISVLQHRVEQQRRALQIAERDLAEARGEAGEVEDVEPGAQRAPGVVADPAELARRIVAADRRARGLEPVEKLPAGSLAAQILAADRKARGEGDE